MNFDFNSPHRVLVQQDASQHLPQLMAGLSAQRVLIITDAGIEQLGLLDDVKAQFTKSAVAYTVFNQVSADPSDQVVQEALAAAQQCSADGIIGFGGGSPMDVAKLVAKLHQPHNTPQLDGKSVV